MPVPIRMTKIHHACLTIDDGSTRILLDPGKFGPRPGLDGVDAVLITHRHVDHLDPDLVAEALRRGVPVWAPGDALGDIGVPDGIEDGGPHEAVPGAALRIGSLSVQVAGERHAEAASVRVRARRTPLPAVTLQFEQAGAGVDRLGVVQRGSVTPRTRVLRLRRGDGRGVHDYASRVAQ